MKNDLRITYPLWMVWFICLFAVTIYLIGMAAIIDTTTKNEITFMLNLESTLIFFITLFVLLILSLIVFLVKIVKHNRKYPQKKFSAFYIKPPEYLDDDELFQLATGRATRKVYTFFSSAIPILALLYILLPIGKMWMVIGILLLGAMQYLIYYIEIRKYVNGKNDL